MREIKNLIDSLKKAALLMCALFLFSGALWAQNVTVTGKVVDKSGEGLPGVYVQIEGIQTGIPSRNDGTFTITAPANGRLIFSLLGMETQTVSINGRSLINVQLSESTLLLEELVVVGYGVQKKRLVTGSTVQVRGEDIESKNETSVLGALQSQAPGVNIVQVSGFIGDDYIVNIRGIGTTGTSSPLFVVDGMVGGSIDGLSPNDIESIDVLKDAATAAIYGSRAANGVILVQTKTGKAGRFEVSYNGYYGVQNLVNLPTALTAQEFMDILAEARTNDGLPPYNWDALLPAKDLASIRNGSWAGTNWIQEIQNKNAPVQSHSVSVNSGTDRSTSSLGFTYFQQEATMGTPSAFPVVDRFNARINTSSILMKKGNLNVLRVGQTLTYRFNEQHGSVSRGGTYSNAIRDAIIMSPFMHAFKEDGSYYMYPDQAADGYWWDTANNANRNPIANMDFTTNQSINKSHQLQTSVFAEIKPISSLTFRTQFGYRMSASSDRSYIPAYGNLTATSVRDIDQVRQSMSLNNAWTWDNTLNYIFKVDKHNVDVLVGQSLTRNVLGETLNGTQQDSNFYDLKHAYLDNVPGLATITALGGEPRLMSSTASFFGRINYNFYETYMLTLILRADGSSNFAPGYRWGYFPSISAGWVVSNEGFWKKTWGIDFLKLRASWGSNGNDRVSSFQYLGLISTGAGTASGYPFGHNMYEPSTGAYSSRGVNPKIKWETQTMVNLGIDAYFLRNRLKLEAEWYNRTTKDWLVAPPQPGDFGVSPASINGGDIQNTGFEIVLGWNERKNRNFYYNANIALSHNKNKVLKIDNGDGIIRGPRNMLWDQMEEIFLVEEGKPIAYFYGYKSDGVFQNQAQIDNYTGPKLLGVNTKPGDIIWRDVNGDGKIDDGDRTMIGNPHPKLTLGLSFNVGYKNFELNVNTFGEFGHQILKSYRNFISYPQSNYTTDVYKERWHGEGTSNRFPRLQSASQLNWNRVSDLYIENGDYLKIKNVSLGYDFKNLVKNTPLGQLKLYVTAQNLFTFTKYPGMDPEIGYGGGSDYRYARGIDLGYYPGARTFMIGTSIKF